MKKLYQREQKHICGEKYMEVDIYDISAKQHKQSIRAKRKEATSLAMQTYNDNNAIRHRVQLVNANFSGNDFAITQTYDDEHLPAEEDRKRVDMDHANYIKRIYRWCDKHGVRRPLWCTSTEYRSFDAEKGKWYGRHHHHTIIEHTEGLTREVLEKLWYDDKKKPIGLCQCDALHFEHGSIEALVRYINKNKRCDRKWRQSKGLQMPKRPRPNDSKWSRKKLWDASTRCIADRDFWENLYPGYIFSRCETKVTDAGMRHTIAIMYKAEIPRSA